MDNVTHSLAGLLLADAALQGRRLRDGRESTSAFRLAATLTGIAAANLPDADLVYTGLGGDTLAYLLHHRGYTHTVLAAVLGALLAWALALGVWRARATRGGGTPAPATRADAMWILSLSLAGTLSHLVLDWTNSYGVHPFWPLDDRWYYGDSVFIVEPWLWVVAVPPLLFARVRRSSRVALGFVLAGGLALAWLVSLVPWGAALALTGGAALCLALVARQCPHTRIATGLVAWVVVTLLFAVSARRARAEVIAAANAHGSGAGARVEDVVVTPMPANPLCASAILVETIGATYVVTTARVASLPALLAPRGCGAPATTGPPLHASARAPTPAVAWDAEWAAPTGELAALGARNCVVAAMLRFVRVPVWLRLDSATVRFGDLRFERGSGAGFATMRVPDRPRTCPTSLPPWVPPRQSLLAPR